MKVKNLQNWFDRKEKTTRKIEDEPYVISKERFDEVNATKFGLLVEEIAEAKVKEEAPKKKK